MNDNTAGRHFLNASGCLAICCVSAIAAELPQIPDPMIHLGIEVSGTDVIAHAPDPALPNNTLPLYNYGETYDAPADVLDGLAYNDQFGWVAHGFITLPAESAIFLKLISKSDGLSTFEGGMRWNRANHSYATILDVPGATWAWGGSMTHHWYAAAEPGLYQATYELYVGDIATGDPVPDYSADRITLQFTYLPEPATLALMAPLLAWSSCRLRRIRGPHER